MSVILSLMQVLSLGRILKKNDLILTILPLRCSHNQNKLTPVGSYSGKYIECGRPSYKDLIFAG